MVDIEKEYDSITPMESLIDEAKKKEQAIHGDLADAITEWAVGAVAGAEEQAVQGMRRACPGSAVSALL